MKKYRGFVLSYNFVPYLNSASIDFYKKIKYMPNFELDVLYVPVGKKEERFFEFECDTKINYIEIPVEHNPNETSIFKSVQIMWLWVFHVVRYYWKNRQKYDFIMSHAFSMLSHLAAIIINVFSNKPWLAYFSDPVKGNPYFEKNYIPIGKLYQIYRYIEKRTMKKADKLIFNNDFQLKLAEQGYGSFIHQKTTTVEHCFDAIMYQQSSKPNKQPDGKLHIVHVGTMFPPKRVATLVIEAFDAYLQEQGGNPHHIVLDFVGPICDYDVATHEKMQYPEYVNFLGQVDYFASLQCMCEADILLLIDADFTSDGVPFSPFLPGKYSEYVGAKKPIMAVTMKEGAVAQKQQAFGYETLEWNKEQIKNYFTKINAIQLSDKYVEVSEQLTAKYQSNHLAQIIMETCAEK